MRNASTLVACALLAACGGSPKTDSRYPARPDSCEVQLFRGKVAGVPYDDIGHVDAICGTDIGDAECLKELKRQTCKLGGDIVYDVPDEPNKPAPDKIRYTGHAAHTRAATPATGAGPSKAPAR